MDGSPEAATGTSAWPSFRRAKRLRRLNNPYSPRRSGAAGALVRLASGRTTPKRLLSLKRGRNSADGGYFPREALEPGSRSADVTQRVWARFLSLRSLEIPHSASSLEPPLTPGMVTSPLTITERGGAFRQDCGLKVTIAQKIRA